MGYSEVVSEAELRLLTGEAKHGPQHNARQRSAWRTTGLSLITACALLVIIFSVVRDDSGPFSNGVDQSTYGNSKSDASRNAVRPFPGFTSEEAPLNLLIVGDWGRKGRYNQSRIAEKMDGVGQELNVDFIISTGDNFYNSGLRNVNDPYFKESFTDVYQGSSLQTTWYAVPGNHDYRGDVDAQVDRALNQRDSRWHSSYYDTIPVQVGQSSTGEAISVEFFLIDTNPFIDYYWTNNRKYTWIRTTPREVVMVNTLANLTASLVASTAKWKVVIGHHTMYSYGSHGNTPEMIEKILPILNEHKVDMYINGHDHCLQHVKRDDSGVHFITSGGGSKAWKNKFQKNIEKAHFYYDGQGFISLSVKPSDVRVDFFDITGAIIHQLQLRK